MCGIAGFLGTYPPEVARRMARRIAHRGPDDEGFFFDPAVGLALAHRRLSILDPSPAGHQPMPDASGRYTICYNGEIYNFPELKRDLEARGVRFRSNCDTEAIVELFAREGPDCFARLNGIFALAIWDRETRELVLARDGVGVKPLYFCRTPSGVAFASEMKALLELPDLDRSIDPAAATAYLSYLWSPGSRTMLRSVEKIEPGSWRALTATGGKRNGIFYRLPYPNPTGGRSDAELIEGTRGALATAVERQMLSDVEVGAFLSGGLDSSAIVAFAREHSRSGDLQCFTIDYRAADDEAGELVPDLPYARRAAAHLGVELHEVQVDAGMADDFERLIYHLDEPEADPAALNSLYIAELARQNGIKVLLSGTGGDDIFTGYRRHSAARIDRIWEFAPRSARQAVERAACLLPTGPTSLRRIRKLLEGIGLPRERRLSGYFEWLSPEAAAGLLNDPPPGAAAAARAPLLAALEEVKHAPAVEQVLRLDQLFFLTDHNLNYADKTGMAAGVEIRVPFLDPDLMDWAASIPTQAKIRGGETKWVLRKAMERHLPNDIIYRPKTGFGVPLRAWLRGGMRPMMEELLSPAAIEARGLFNSAQVTLLKEQTLAGRRDGSYALLGLMAMELWARRFIDSGPATAEHLAAPHAGRVAAGAPF
jgi:asparagine synthase (glutamine-hydrolysing)